MRQFTTYILLVVFSLPSIMGLGLHGLMPCGATGRPCLSDACSCHHHDSEPAEHRHADDGCFFPSVAPAVAVHHSDTCSICLFCMSHKSAVVVADSVPVNLLYSSLTCAVDSFVPFLSALEHTARGPPLSYV